MINTLKISKQLEAASLSKAQADAIAEALADVTTAELATSQLELRLSKDIGALRQGIGALRDSLTKEIHNISSRILWPVGVLALITWILQAFGTSIGTAIRHALGQP
jgi:hypothetical protein